MSANPILHHEDAEIAAFSDAVQEGIHAADEGRKRPYAEIRRWLLSWGTEQENLTPQRGQP